MEPHDGFLVFPRHSFGAFHRSGALQQFSENLQEIQDKAVFESGSNTVFSVQRSLNLNGHPGWCCSRLEKVHRCVWVADHLWTWHCDQCPAQQKPESALVLQDLPRQLFRT